MTGSSADAPRGEFLPPDPTVSRDTGAVGEEAAAHAIAEARAQAAAARRVRAQTGEKEHVAADYTGLVTRAGFSGGAFDCPSAADSHIAGHRRS